MILKLKTTRGDECVKKRRVPSMESEIVFERHGLIETKI